MFDERRDYLRRSKQKFLPERRVQVGSEGERQVEEVLRQAAKKLRCRSIILCGRRVPRSDRQGKGEIDAILASEFGILVIEVKKLYGPISWVDGKWVQQHGQKKHENPIAKVHQKMEDLMVWLAGRNVNVPDRRVSAKVVMVNGTDSLSAKIRKQKAVVGIVELDHIALQVCGRPGGWFWQRQLRKPWRFRELVKQTSLLPQYDELMMHGGRRYTGDVKRLRLQIRGGKPLKRFQVRKAVIKQHRNLLGMIFRPRVRVTDWNNNTRIYPLDEQCEICMQLAGQAELTTFSVAHVGWLRLGWQNEDYYRLFADHATPECLSRDALGVKRIVGASISVFLLTAAYRMIAAVSVVVLFAAVSFAINRGWDGDLSYRYETGLLAPLGPWGPGLVLGSVLALRVLLFGPDAISRF